MVVNPSHGPNRFISYQEIHETVIAKFKARDFICSDTLDFKPLPNGIRLKGEIGCRGNIIVSVDKFLKILSGSGENALIQTRWYTYNAFLRGGYNIFRYDNQDEGYLRPDHQDDHHKHLFDWESGLELPESPIWIGESSWLNLGQVLAELEDWYWMYHNDLSEPYSCPELALR